MEHFYPESQPKRTIYAGTCSNLFSNSLAAMSSLRSNAQCWSSMDRTCTILPSRWVAKLFNRATVSLEGKVWSIGFTLEKMFLSICEETYRAKFQSAPSSFSSKTVPRVYPNVPVPIHSIPVNNLHRAQYSYRNAAPICLQIEGHRHLEIANTHKVVRQVVRGSEQN